jgi:hypothetical protein
VEVILAASEALLLFIVLIRPFIEVAALELLLVTVLLMEVTEEFREADAA